MSPTHLRQTLRSIAVAVALCGRPLAAAYAIGGPSSLDLKPEDSQATEIAQSQTLRVEGALFAQTGVCRPDQDFQRTIRLVNDNDSPATIRLLDQSCHCVTVRVDGRTLIPLADGALAPPTFGDYPSSNAILDALPIPPLPASAQGGFGRSAIGAPTSPPPTDASTSDHSRLDCYVIPPHNAVRLEIEWNAGNSPGPYQHWCRILTSDGQLPGFVFHATGEVASLIETSADEVDLTQASETHPARVVVATRFLNDLELSLGEGNSCDFVARVSPLDAARAGFPRALRAYEVAIWPTSSAPRGSVRGVVRLRTDHAETPELAIACRGELSHNRIRFVTNRELAFAAVDPAIGQEQTFCIEVEADQPVVATASAGALDFVACDVEVARSGEDRWLMICHTVVLSDAPSGFFDGAVEICTNLEMPPIRVAISGEVLGEEGMPTWTAPPIAVN